MQDYVFADSWRIQEHVWYFNVLIIDLLDGISSFCCIIGVRHHIGMLCYGIAIIEDEGRSFLLICDTRGLKKCHHVHVGTRPREMTSGEN